MTQISLIRSSRRIWRMSSKSKTPSLPPRRQNLALLIRQTSWKDSRFVWCRYASRVVGWLLISSFSNSYSCSISPLRWPGIPCAISSTVNWWPGWRRTRGSSCEPDFEDWLARRWIIHDGEDRRVTRPVKDGMKRNILLSATAKIRELF